MDSRLLNFNKTRMKSSKVLLTLLIVVVPAGESLVDNQKGFYTNDFFQRYLWFATAARMNVKIPSVGLIKTEVRYS